MAAVDHEEHAEHEEQEPIKPIQPEIHPENPAHGGISYLESIQPPINHSVPIGPLDLNALPKLRPDAKSAPRPPNPDDTKSKPVIFIDWDDTVIPASALANETTKMPKTLSPEVVARMVVLQDALIMLIVAISAIADICIVTNAELGWVEISCKRFLPKLANYLKHTAIHSAKHHHGAQAPNNPLQWKFDAFKYLIRVARPMPTHVLSIGDSICERIALNRVCAELNISCATIKMFESPSIEQLKTQILFLLVSLQRIISLQGDYDIVTCQQPALQCSANPCDALNVELVNVANKIDPNNCAAIQVAQVPQAAHDVHNAQAAQDVQVQVIQASHAT